MQNWCGKAKRSEAACLSQQTNRGFFFSPECQRLTEHDRPIRGAYFTLWVGTYVPLGGSLLCCLCMLLFRNHCVPVNITNNMGITTSHKKIPIKVAFNSQSLVFPYFLNLNKPHKQWMADLGCHSIATPWLNEEGLNEKYIT